MLFESAIPTSISTPIRDITFNVLWVSGRMMNTPTNPIGMASMIKKGSMNDLNWAVRIRKSKTNEIRKPSAKLLNEASMPCTIPRKFTRTLPGMFVLARMLRTALVMRPRSSPLGVT